MTAKKSTSKDSNRTADGGRRRESRKSPAASALSAIKQRDAEGRASGLGPDIEVPSFDPLVASELIEACRAHLASVIELTDVTVLTLREFYEYEHDEPHLWQCCELVRQVLMQVQAALIPLGIVSHEEDPFTRAAEIAKGCDDQRRLLLCPSVHVIRASIHILRGVEPNDHDQGLPALRDLESGLTLIIAGLDRVIEACPC